MFVSHLNMVNHILQTPWSSWCYFKEEFPLQAVTKVSRVALKTTQIISSECASRNTPGVLARCVWGVRARVQKIIASERARRGATYQMLECNTQESKGDVEQFELERSDAEAGTNIKMSVRSL